MYINDNINDINNIVDINVNINVTIMWLTGSR